MNGYLEADHHSDRGVSALENKSPLVHVGCHHEIGVLCSKTAGSGALSFVVAIASKTVVPRRP